MMGAANIAAALSRRVQRLPNGGYLVPCPLPSHGRGRGDRSPSLSIRDGDERLLVRCYAGCDPRDVLDELRRCGLLDAREPERERPKARPATPQPAHDYAEQQHAKAAWLWSQRRPITGTIAERYLREVRAISCPLPATLGFLPSRQPGQWPAMIAAFGLPNEPEPSVLAAPQSVTSVHLTLLKPDGSGKADTGRPKLMVGSPGALPIVLAPVNDLGGLAITEGIEDALSVHAATGLGAWAAGAAGRMPGLAGTIPAYVEAVTICAHDDAAGRNGGRQLAESIPSIGRVTEVLIEGVS